MALDDTHPRARAVQIDALRRLSPEQRLQMVHELTEMTTWGSREAVRRAMPSAREQEVLLRWIEVVYGQELARAVAPFASRLGVPGSP